MHACKKELMNFDNPAVSIKQHYQNVQKTITKLYNKQATCMTEKCVKEVSKFYGWNVFFNCILYF